MTCIRIEHGFVCGEDDFVDLRKYGAHIWLSWHHYHGPTFYKSKNAIKPIIVPSKKTWDAFQRWLDNRYIPALQVCDKINLTIIA